MTALAEGIGASGFRPDSIYLDTPTYGLASDAVVDAMNEALERWRRGVATMPEYDDAVASSRELFAGIVGADVDRVAVANQVSVFVGMIASSLPRGSTALVADGEFTSVLFPLLVQQAKGITVRTAPADDLAAAIDDDVDLVAFSLVHSADGRLADVDAIEAAARRYGVRILVDVTQAAGWLPIDAGRFDYLVASAYKWLMCPRGTAFMALGGDADSTITPLAAGWYAGEEPWGSIYGGPLRLAASARRFDVSPAWLSWVGTVPALERIAGAGVSTIHRHDIGLATRAREQLGLESSGSAILIVPVADASKLTDRGIAAAVRSDSVRVGFHLYNDIDDVDALVNAVRASGLTRLRGRSPSK